MVKQRHVPFEHSDKLLAPHSDHRLPALSLVELMGDLDQLRMRVEENGPTVSTIVLRLIDGVNFVTALAENMPNGEVLATEDPHQSRS